MLPTLSLFLLYGHATQLHCQVHVSEFFYPVEFNRAKKPMLENSAWITNEYNSVMKGFSFSFHKNYKLDPTYPRLAIFSLRELHQTSPSALRAETSFRYQSDPLRTTQTKRVPAWPVINQLWFLERHFSANGVPLCLCEVQMKICKGWLQALLSPAPRGLAARSRVLARLASVAQIGELARMLGVICWLCFYFDELPIYKWTEPWDFKGRFPESWGLRASVSSSPLPLQPFFSFPL